MLILECVNDEINMINDIVDKIYADERSWYGQFRDEIVNIIKIMDVFVKLVPALNSKGLELPEEVLVTQMNRLNESVAVNDFMMLADGLKYEIIDSLVIFRELIEGGIIRNEELL